MIRTLLAAALAVALVGGALPAVDDARVHRSERLVHGELAAVERAADSLLAADETAPTAGARRTVTLTLPGGSWRGADVDALRIRGPEDASDGRASVTYRIDGAGRRTVPLEAPLYTPDGPVVVGDGRERLTLTLVAVDGERVVRVRAGPGRPTVYDRTGDHPGV